MSCVESMDDEASQSADAGSNDVSASKFSDDKCQAPGPKRKNAKTTNRDKKLPRAAPTV
jgi:hypothetical protein